MTGDERRAAIAETHVSVIVFIGDYAYKLKKPVSMGFLDFSTREAREKACRREVELNRRLAPDVYLGVAEVKGPDGRPCDHLVVMRRMPASRRLAALVRGRADVSEGVRQVARLVASFHERAGTSVRSPQRPRWMLCGGTGRTTSSGWPPWLAPCWTARRQLLPSAWPAGIWKAAGPCSTIGSRRGWCATATATCWPRTSSCWMTAFASSTASSSTTASATETC